MHYEPPYSRVTELSLDAAFLASGSKPDGYDAPTAEQFFLDLEENMLESELGQGGSKGKEGLENKDIESIGYEPL